MENPIAHVKLTRETWSKSLNRKVTEVQVQFAKEEPAWIPIETLAAMTKLLEEREKAWIKNER
jgi:hypothetical protein